MRDSATIAINKSHKFIVDLKSIDAMPGKHSLEIYSQSMVAKHPEQMQRKFQVTLDSKDLAALLGMIRRYALQGITK